MNPKNWNQVRSPPTTSSLEMDRAYSGFDTSYICHLLTLPAYLQPQANTLEDIVCLFVIAGKGLAYFGP